MTELFAVIGKVVPFLSTCHTFLAYMTGLLDHPMSTDNRTGSIRTEKRHTTCIQKRTRNMHRTYAQNDTVVGPSTGSIEQRWRQEIAHTSHKGHRQLREQDTEQDRTGLTMQETGPISRRPTKHIRHIGDSTL